MATSYGLINVGKKKIILTSVFVGCFHFLMPYIGNKIGNNIFSHTLIKPNIILFIVFLLLSVDMFISFFEKLKKRSKFNLLNIIVFSFSVSFDSFSVGLGIDYLFDNRMLAFLSFSIVSFLFTLLGFTIGKYLSKKLGKISFLIAGTTLFMYAIKILTK